MSARTELKTSHCRLGLRTPRHPLHGLSRACALALPSCFVLAGAGMLMQLPIERADVPFFTRLAIDPRWWIGSHIVLLASQMLMLPAAIALRREASTGRAGAVSTAALLVIAMGATLLGGQYAIDLVMPHLAAVGGPALEVHARLLGDPLIDGLFYGLPNLVFLAFMIAMMAAAAGGRWGRWRTLALVAVWLVVLLGNLLDPVVQRSGIILLAPVVWPVAVKQWRGNVWSERASART